MPKIDFNTKEACERLVRNMNTEDATLLPNPVIKNICRIADIPEDHIARLLEHIDKAREENEAKPNSWTTWDREDY